MKFTKDT